MVKVARHIEIVSSSISQLSSMSKESRHAIHRVLSKYYQKVGISLIDSVSDLEALVAKKPDVVLLGMKYVPSNSSEGSGEGNKVWLADYLEAHDIVTTGSPSIAHKRELDKSLAKQSVANAGVRTSDFIVIDVNQTIKKGYCHLEFPLFVKPLNRGGGLGVDTNSVVYNLAQLERKVNSITEKLKSPALIERYLPGREFSVAILRSRDKPEYSAMPIELIAPVDNKGVRILGGAIKSANAEKAIAVADEDTKRSVADEAVLAFKAIGGRDYGRIDIRMDENGIPYFLEANLIPSLINNYGSFPKACALNKGIPYEDMILRIVELGLARANKSRFVNAEAATARGLTPSTATL